MRTTNASDQGRERPTFYTVAEAARVLRVDPATIYRAIREDAFPAVRVRSRYVIPVAAVDQMAEQAAETGTCRRGRDRVHTADRPRGRPRDGRSAMSRHDERSPDFERRAAELDSLSHVPTEFLLDLVEQSGMCW